MGGFPHCIEHNHMLHWWCQLSEVSDLHECPEQGNSYCCLEPWPMIEMKNTIVWTPLLILDLSNILNQRLEHERRPSSPCCWSLSYMLLQYWKCWHDQRNQACMHLACLCVQLDECGDLDVIVRGSNWELLSGKVRDVQVSATNAIYKVCFNFCFHPFFSLEW